ncbi:hypothetical protein [Cerasibacillus terrae]
MKFGDTNFIGVANVEEYRSFVDEDWDLDILLKHFGYETKKGNLLVFQMTEEGIEHSWNINVKIGADENISNCFRRVIGYLKVTNNQLFLVDYDCLTMAAQFKHEKVPDENCSNYKIDIKNGDYKVEVIQYYNVDENEYVGTNQTDISLNFIETSNFQPVENHVFWCTF